MGSKASDTLCRKKIKGTWFWFSRRMLQRSEAKTENLQRMKLRWSICENDYVAVVSRLPAEKIFWTDSQNVVVHLHTPTCEYRPQVFKIPPCSIVLHKAINQHAKTVLCLCVCERQTMLKIWKHARKVNAWIKQHGANFPFIVHNSLRAAL